MDLLAESIHAMEGMPVCQADTLFTMCYAILNSVGLDIFFRHGTCNMGLVIIGAGYGACRLCLAWKRDAWVLMSL